MRKTVILLTVSAAFGCAGAPDPVVGTYSGTGSVLNPNSGYSAITSSTDPLRVTATSTGYELAITFPPGNAPPCTLPAIATPAGSTTAFRISGSCTGMGPVTDGHFDTRWTGGVLRDFMGRQLPSTVDIEVQLVFQHTAPTVDSYGTLGFEFTGNR